MSQTESYSKDKRAVIGWVATTLGGAALAVAGWAHQKLWAHEVTLSQLDERSRAVDARATASDKRLDRMEEKLDRILDELRRKP